MLQGQKVWKRCLHAQLAHPQVAASLSRKQKCETSRAYPPAAWSRWYGETKISRFDTCVRLCGTSAEAVLWCSLTGPCQWDHLFASATETCFFLPVVRVSAIVLAGLSFTWSD